jgi:hypothetical protein
MADYQKTTRIKNIMTNLIFLNRKEKVRLSRFLVKLFD